MRHRSSRRGRDDDLRTTFLKAIRSAGSTNRTATLRGRQKNRDYSPPLTTNLPTNCVVGSVPST